MHAVPRLVFNGLIDNIQTSWVKMGHEGALLCLDAGANDLGGTLMNESITRAAGAGHGQEWAPHDIEEAIRSIGREPMMRNTRYQSVNPERREAAFNNKLELLDCVQESAGKIHRNKKLLEVAELG
jgi:FO synthase